MLIGIPRERRPGETRVAATPTTVGQMIKLGYDVVVEAGAGTAASLPDSAFAEAGAHLGTAYDAWGADIVFAVEAPSDQEIAAMKDGGLLAAILAPGLHPELVEKLAARRITALAMDTVPRISRAQSMDVLSSMANLSGYRAVIEAAHEFGRLFTGQVTAAGKVPPAKVFVAGAGVAGLAAIGAAGSLGAIVRANDVRPEVAEQVHSMGAEFVRVEDAAAEVSTDGYAKEMGEDYQRRQAEMYARQAADVDIIITTALIPGRPAPRLITGEMIATMTPGSVIVDMAAATGGNVEGSVPGERVVTENGVIILGYTDLAGRLPTQASQLYGTNLVNMLKLITPGKDGQYVLDMEDVVQRGVTVVLDGELMWPPPKVQVSAAPAASTGATAVEMPEKAEKAGKAPMSGGAKLGIIAGAAALFLLTAGFAPEPFLGHFMVFMLSCVIGYYVIGNVHHALHTPLMSVTNAISGIIIVGALLQVGHPGRTGISVLAFIGILVASINVFGGFTLTARMLDMFRKDA